MNGLSKLSPVGANRPASIVIDEPPFVPRLVMTVEHHALIRTVVSQWKKRDRFTAVRPYGIRPLDKLLFYGPPGNGKTMTCHWIAKTLDMQMFRVRCDQLHGSYLGQTTKAIVEVTDWLDRQRTPCLCLFDEAEHIFVNRAKTEGVCGREVGSALTVFMQALDRWTSPALLVLATNLPDQLDAALMSRIDCHLEFLGPTPEQAVELVQYWAEILSSHGGGDWGPQLLDTVQRETPPSFRAMKHLVDYAAREWIVSRGDK